MIVSLCTYYTHTDTPAGYMCLIKGQVEYEYVMVSVLVMGGMLVVVMVLVMVVAVLVTMVAWYSVGDNGSYWYWG